MYINYSLDILHQKLEQLKSGIIFVNIAAKRINMALRLAEKRLNEIDFIVWIAPANLLHTLIYTNEIKKNAQGFRHKIIYYAAESISVSDSKYLDLYNLIHNNKTFCIMDESLFMKNTESGRTQRLLTLGPHFTYRLMLSSSPISRSLTDLYTQLHFLNPKILNMNSQQFSNTFMPYSYSNYLIMKRWSRPKEVHKLMELIKPYIFSYDITKRYIIRHYDRYFDLTPQEEESYKYEKSVFLQKRSQIVFMDIVQNFQKMYTVSINKLHGLQTLIQEISSRKEKVVVYTKFLDEIDIIVESRILGDLKYVELSSRTNKRRAIKQFERNIDIMLCTYGVEKFGLNMQICNNVIYFSQTFDYKCKLQSLDSILFQGFPTYLNVYDFWVKTNLEQLINDSLEHKQNVISNVCSKLTKVEALKL